MNSARRSQEPVETRDFAPAEQLSFAFPDAEDANNAAELAIPAMPRQARSPVSQPTPPAPPASLRVPHPVEKAKVAAFRKAVARPTAADTEKETERVLAEGLHIRYASVQRYLKLHGPFDFTKPAPEVPPPASFKDLVPAFLKRVPDGWTVEPRGFVYPLERPDAATMAKLVNARRDELGVFHCEKSERSWLLVFDF